EPFVPAVRRGVARATCRAATPSCGVLFDTAVGAPFPLAVSPAVGVPARASQACTRGRAVGSCSLAASECRRSRRFHRLVVEVWMTRATRQRFVAHVPRRFTPNSWGGTERVLQETLP